MGRTHDCHREAAFRTRLHGGVGGLQQAPAAAGRHVLYDVANVLQLDAAELRALRQQAPRQVANSRHLWAHTGMPCYHWHQHSTALPVYGTAISRAVPDMPSCNTSPTRVWQARIDSYAGCRLNRRTSALRRASAKVVTLLPLNGLRLLPWRRYDTYGDTNPGM